MPNASKHEVRIPDIEVKVSVASFDCYVVALYAGKTPADGFEMVGQVYDMDDRLRILEVLQAAVTFLRADNWITMDELDTRPVEDERKDPPF